MKPANSAADKQLPDEPAAGGGMDGTATAERSFQLAPQQRRLWAHYQDGAVFQAHGAIRLVGELDRDSFAEAVRRVVGRHQILRTVFRATTAGPEPSQIVDDRAPTSLTQVDLRRTPSEHEHYISEFLGAAPSVDLGRGPLVHMRLVALGSDRHTLLVSLPALCADARTLVILVRDLRDAYQDCLRGVAPAALPLQYAAVASWLSELAAQSEDSPGLRYWRRKELSSLPVLRLPYGAAEPGAKRWQACSVSRVFDEATAALLQATAARAGAAAESVWLACWQIALWRLSGYNEFVIGATFDGRKYEELSGTLGPLSRHAPIESRLWTQLPFGELLRRTDRTLADARRWSDSFDWERAGLAPPSGMLPYFPLAFDFQVGDIEPGDAPLAISLADWSAQIDRFDLELACRRRDDGLEARFCFDAAQLAADEVELIADRFCALVAGIARDPTLTIGAYRLESPAEHERLIFGLNNTRVDRPELQPCNRTFEARAAQQPDNVAVWLGDQQLSYGTLNARANQLARYLRRLGVGANARVAVCLERSPSLIVSLLAILKAGGAYVPLDPSYPRERLAFMLQDSDAALLLTEQQFSDWWSALVHGCEGAAPTASVCLETVWTELAQECTDDLPPTASLDDLAYVVYTSGSTGKPKGVMNTHRGLANLLNWMQRTFDLAESDRVLQKTPLSFDVATWEVFWPLSAGARIVLAAPGVHRNVAALCTLIREAGITTIHFVPSVLELFLEQPEVGACTSLKRVLCGGESLDVATQQRFFQRLHAELHHLYGPSEAAIDVTWWHCASGEGQLRVPIGRPISNVQIYVLDERLEPAPIGVVGQLYIGGTALARGYLNRPESTAERFIPHPFSAEPGARLYRTGDLARVRPDGAIEFIGRLDHQLKLRGCRIELEEIEVTLRRYPAVSRAVVVDRPDHRGEHRLVAYVVASRKPSPSPRELRGWLAATLPDFMLPTSFVRLGSLPLLPNGKIDRRALPDPGPRDSVEGAGDAPQTPVEELLAGIWADVLGIERVGRSDGFFELGGHSLIATQVVSRATKAFGVSVTLQAVLEAPTLADLARLVEAEVTSAQRTAALSIRPVRRDQPLPLSFSQQRLWFIDQLRPGDPAYNIAAGVRISGGLEAEVLRRAFEEIVRRHETLRTTFVEHDGAPRLLIASEMHIPFTITDLSAWNGDQEAETRRRLVAEAVRPFDLERGPLIRVTLLRLADDVHVLLLVMHHIVSDDWSMGVLTREGVALYTALRTGKSSPLPQLPIQYLDFAYWQRQWLESTLDVQLGYWRKQLRGPLPTLELPIDRPRPAVQTSRGQQQSRQLTPVLSRSLAALGRQHGATLFMTLLAAFAALLHRLSGQTDLLIGSPIANRNRLETEALIGFFVNFLVLRIDLANDPTFGELLKRTRRVALDAYTHQDLPFEKIVQALQPERDLSRSPLFQVAFILHNAPKPPLEVAGLTLTPIDIDIGTSKYDLVLSMVDSEQGLTASIQYNTDLFSSETIARLLEHFEILLEGIVEHPERPISRLPLLAESQRQRVLVEWNRTASGYPYDRCVHRLFERQAARSPDALAVAYGDERLSYRELERQANCLARQLRTLGVGRESVVGICLEQSGAMVVAMLGVLKAGAAYLPLDPHDPHERLVSILEDARAALVLCGPGRRDVTPGDGRLVVELDTVADSRAGDDLGPPRDLVSSDGLACVLYTSGSTGRPKGVCITHRAITRLVYQAEPLNISPADRIAQVSNPAFDAVTFEVWSALLHGACMVGISKDVLLSPEALAAQIREQRLTVAFVTTALFNQLASANPQAFKGLDRLIFGGEIADSKTVSAVLAAGPPPRLVHAYGPTESTTFTTCQLVETVEGNTVPIGWPLRNTQVYILDAQLQPVPIGVTGKLYIGGPGLGRCYLHRPDLTAERFIPHPFSREAGARLYDTGDLARFLPDGSLDFVGRVDDQVKIRGHRVELGEIEAALRRHTAVKHAVVSVVLDGSGQKQLVAYFVPTTSPAPSKTTLRRFLEQRLPSYMLPFDIVSLEALPLTANGKIDRAALPAPALSRAVRDEPYRAPGSLAEQRIAEIWEKLLGNTWVGSEDNFFALGGHSLLAAQLVSRLRDAFGVDVSLQLLFDSPTVAGLAAAIQRLRSDGRHAPAPPIGRAPRGMDMPLSPAQEQLWAVEQALPGRAFFNINGAFHLVGRLDAQVLAQCVEEIVRRHEALRTSFAQVGGSAVQVVSASLKVPVSLESLERLPSAERWPAALRLTRAEAKRPFNLVTGPLLRVTLLRLAQQDHVVVFTMHHIIGDGWSMNLLIYELSTLYAAYSTAAVSPLSEPGLQFIDFVWWQREQLRNGGFNADLAYWRRRLEGSAAPMHLAAAGKEPCTLSFRTARCAATLPNALVDRMRALGRQEGVTLFMVMLAALKGLLCHRAGSEDIRVGTMLANRDRTEFEGAVGCLVNTVVLRTDVSGDPTLLELLRRVRQTVLDAQAHGELPFEALLQQLDVGRGPARAALFQVMFLLDEQTAPLPRLPGLAAEPLALKAGPDEVDVTATTLDLILRIVPDEQGMVATLTYKTELFDGSAAGLLGLFQRVLERLVSQPDCRLSAALVAAGG